MRFAVVFAVIIALMAVSCGGNTSDQGPTASPPQVTDNRTPTITGPTSVPTPIPTLALREAPESTESPTPIPATAPPLEPTATPAPTPELTATPAPTRQSASLTVAEINVAAGSTTELEAYFADESGEVLGIALVDWTLLDSNAGSLTKDGAFTAGEVAGSYEAAIMASSIDRELSHTAIVTIVPTVLAQVILGPNPADIGMGIEQQFVAVGGDRFGNGIYGLSFTWKVERGGGVIDANGLFIAGDEPGEYTDSIVAVAQVEGVTASGSASVIVEQDRIAFISSRGGNPPDVYVMDVDGNNVRRLTVGNIGFSRLAWAPNGRKITYYTADNIYVVSDDGRWLTTLVDEIAPVFDAFWSPDGSQFAYVLSESPSEGSDNLEIYVADSDGGNATRITENELPDRFPVWSPDGLNIAFSRTPASGRTEIYLVDADGSDPRKLRASDIVDRPRWSPDGRHVVVQAKPSPGDRSYLGELLVQLLLMYGIDDPNSYDMLTSLNGDDFNPSYSSDGRNVVFHSFRDTTHPDPADDDERQQGAEIYILDRNTNKVTRLTDNDVFDGNPEFAPRKLGVEASEGSLVIPYASKLNPLSPVQVLRNSRESVVAIETRLDIASKTGSGFIIDESGLIMTNNHVINGGGTITVTLDDGAVYDAKVVGRDLVRDLAVIQIEVTGLPSLNFGEVGRLETASDVLVVGYPLNSDVLTITRGLVSAIKTDSSRNVLFLQTDSAINPGNSGGPLLNLQGEVVGVVSAKLVSVGVEGVGLAISSNTVKTYIDRLIAGEEIKS